MLKYIVPCSLLCSLPFCMLKCNMVLNSQAASCINWCSVGGPHASTVSLNLWYEYTQKKSDICFLLLWIVTIIIIQWKIYLYYKTSSICTGLSKVKYNKPVLHQTRPGLCGCHVLEECVCVCVCRGKGRGGGCLVLSSSATQLLHDHS